MLDPHGTARPWPRHNFDLSSAAPWLSFARDSTASDPAQPGEMSLRFVPWTIESTRRKWEIVSRNKRKTSPLGGAPEQAELVQPRTSVNNCKDTSMSASSERMRPKQPPMHQLQTIAVDLPTSAHVWRSHE